jgi:3-phenylpropionate/trans-cinnamate dioxygenase ferredoxin reductase subunit
VADREVDFLLVGAGIASAHCASELRKRGASGSILMVGREPEPPYDRPPLSKDYLRGESNREDALVHPRDWYEQNGVELQTGKSVMSLDPEARTAKIQGGEEVAFDKALLATGAMVNLLRVDGVQLEGIHYLRAFGNSDSIRDDIADAEHVVCVGGSYIGVEVAASMIELGKRCTIVEIEPVVLSRVFGEDVGRHFHELLTARGVEIASGRRWPPSRGTSGSARC